MRVFIKGAAAVAVAALFPVIGAAQQGPPPQGPPPQGRGGMRAAQADRQFPGQRPQLTDEQREQMRTSDEQQRAAGETARRELGDLHRQLNEALTSAQIDNGKVSQLRAAIVQRETALAQQRVDRLAKIASMLTAEQRQALRGRGIGAAFGPGRAGGAGRGGVMAGPGGQRGMVGRQRGMAPGQRGMAGRQRDPAGAPGRNVRQRRGAAGGGDDARIRADIRRLEAQIDALRRRIR